MFERYTEKARRVIFFARYEASQFGSPYIETEHLLLGVLREDKALTNRFLRTHGSVESIRKQIEGHTTIREKVSTSVDLPLSNEGKRVLAYAAEEAERLSHRHIGTEHLLLGLLREEKCFAAEILHERGLRLSAIREELKSKSHISEPGSHSTDAPVLRAIQSDLTQLASEGQLHAFVGREKEMEALIRLLGRSSKNNVVLVGESGVGKRAMVEGLAERIVEEEVPPALLEMRVVDLNISQIARQSRETVLCWIEGVFAVLASASAVSLPHPGEIFKSLVMDGAIKCICPATPEEYRRAKKEHGWVGRFFSELEIAPMTEEETTAVLMSAKTRLENFHSVTFSQEVIGDIVRYSTFFVKNRPLPDKALDLMDEAAAYAKSAGDTEIPDEISEVQKRIKFIVHRMELAIANHEFEKARFYSDEERKERENLRVLESKHHLNEKTNAVTRDDVQQVLARWTGIPLETIQQGPSSQS